MITCGESKPTKRRAHLAAHTVTHATCATSQPECGSAAQLGMVRRREGGGTNGSVATLRRPGRGTLECYIELPYSEPLFPDLRGPRGDGAGAGRGQHRTRRCVPALLEQEAGQAVL